LYSYCGIDIKPYENKYPDERFICLEHKANLIFKIDETTGKVVAKTTHKVKFLALEDEVDELSLVSLPYNSFEELNMKTAKYYTISKSGKERTIEKISPRFVKTKDYYINSAIYNDIKVKQFKPLAKIEKGDMLSVEYEVIHRDLKFLTRIFPNMWNASVENFELNVLLPAYVNIDIHEYNFTANGLKKTTENEDDQLVIKYSAKNLIAPADYKFSPPTMYVQPHLIICVNDIIENGKSKNILSSTDDLYAWYSSLIQKLNPDKTKIQELSTRILEGETNQRKQIEKLFNWVQNSITYLSHDQGIAGFQPTEAHIVAKNYYGDCKGMANLLVTLLKTNNIEAYHTWIGTRNVPYNYDLPSLAMDNHMICTVILDGEYYFLDATNKIISWDRASNHLQGKTAMIGKSINQYELYEIPIDKAISNKVIINCNVSNLTAPALNAKGTIDFFGAEKDRVDYKYKFTKNSKTGDIGNSLAFKYLPHFKSVKRDLPYVIKKDNSSTFFDGQITGSHIKTKDNIILYLNFEDYVTRYIICDEDRNLYFDNEKYIELRTKIEIPEGYTCNDIPNSVVFDETNELAYSMEVQKMDGYINVVQKIKIGRIFLPKPESDIWNQFITTIKSSQEQTLVFNSIK
jgi:transglutaminase-like putative cysteine protease